MRTRLLVALLALPALVAAQRPDTLPDLTVGVIRTAGGALAAFGGAVTVLDGPTVSRQRLATGLDEALAFVPGVLAANRWNPSLDQRLVIRGFGARANFGVRGIKVLIDGIPQTLPDGQSQLTNLDLAQLERVEVLRGAASALHGNAAGGVVAFTTRTAARGTDLELGTEAGTFGTWRVQGRVASGSAVQGVSIAASRTISDGFRAQSASEQRRVQVAYDRRLSGALRLLVRGAWADDPQAENPGALTVAEAGRTPDEAAPNNLRRRADKAVTQGQLAVGLDIAAGAWQGDVRAWVVGRDLENPLAAPAPAPTTADEGLWVGITRRGGGARATATRGLGAGRLALGLDVQQVADDRINRRHLRGDPFGAALLDQRETTREVGPFVQVEWPLAPHLRVKSGVRYDAVRFEVLDNLVAARGGVRTLDAFSGHAGVTWQRDALTAWSSVATSFETPTTTEFANRPDGSTGLNTVLGPQRSVSAELGARTTVGAVALEVAGWRTETDEVITPVQEVGGRSFFANLGGSRTQGLELLASTPISGAVTALANYTYTDARYTDEAGALAGNRVAGIPRHLARIGVRGVVAGFALDVDHAITTSQYADDANGIEIAGWGAGVSGVRIARTVATGGGTARLFVAVQNLWARRYVGSVTVNGGFGRVAEPAAGRVVSAGVVLGR